MRTAGPRQDRSMWAPLVKTSPSFAEIQKVRENINHRSYICFAIYCYVVVYLSSLLFSLNYSIICVVRVRRWMEQQSALFLPR